MINDYDTNIKNLKITSEIYYTNKRIVHITNLNGSWKNGTITSISDDFFMLDELLEGEQPIFYIQIKSIEPYKEKKE